MIEWRKVPWPLWAYVAIGIAGMVVVLLTASAPVAPTVFFVVFMVTWNVFLLTGIRWLWIATLVVEAAILAGELATAGGTWYGDLLGVIDLILLLLSGTRRFFARAEVVAAD